MTIEVHIAERDDIEAMADAQVAGWRVGYRGLFPDDYLDADEFDQQRRDMWRNGGWLDNPSTTVFAGSVDGRVLGFAISGTERPEEGDEPTGRGEIYSFYLHPDAWGSGLASALMDRAEDDLRTRGFTEAVLWALRDNPRGRRFYEKSGWTFDGVETMWDGPTSPTVAKPEPMADVQYHRDL